MSSFFLSLTIVYIFAHGTIGYAIDCTETPYMCMETTIECTEDEDCFIACNTDQSCETSTILCPINGDCNIECDGWQSCFELTINSLYSKSGNLNILCTDSTDHCNSIKILGSIIETYSGSMNLLCNGGIQSCMKSYIQCPISGNCLISCNTDKSCKFSNIIGPNHGDLIVNCNAERSCFGSIFNGTQSNNMDIVGCIAMESCLNMSIYCPINNNQTDSPNCFIQGNDNIGNIEIYATNGWSDIQIDYSGNFKSTHGGTMHCGNNNYEINCNIASNDWKCENNNNLQCNIFESTEVLSNLIPLETLPNLTNDFERGSMGMVLVGGGLLAIAIGCIFCGVTKHFITKYKSKKIKNGKTSNKYKSANDKSNNIIKENKNVPRIQSIIDGEDPSYEDSHGIIHHQHNQHERKMSSLHDNERVKRI